MTHSILVADDDPQIREVLKLALERDGFAVTAVADGKLALQAFSTNSADLVILDISMPHLDGYQTLKELRKTSGVPVLFLSARDDEIDKVLGLELGGDDYVTKPFSPRELIARIRAILKRGIATETNSAQTRGALRLNTQTRDCTFNTTPIKLTQSEFLILQKLLDKEGAVLAKPAIFDLLYNGNPNASDRTVDSHIRNLRSKLDAAGAKEAIETLHGIGIKLGPCNI
ncbi:MAG: response regulator transcription factor [Pseudomonadota bacterium]